MTRRGTSLEPVRNSDTGRQERYRLDAALRATAVDADDLDATTLGPGTHATSAHGESGMSEHRDAAEQSLLDAKHNPVLSAEQSFSAAQVHALLAIEQRLGELLTLLRLDARVGQTL